MNLISMESLYIPVTLFLRTIRRWMLKLLYSSFVVDARIDSYGQFYSQLICKVQKIIEQMRCRERESWRELSDKAMNEIIE
ncbi:hypothetical protein [Sripur virus]|uniref:Uncharacterized protein n=1 Tax=Sripur virus TaxID=1620897 RepID=A0A0D3R1T4_9RHAB|nr:hypothetical protein [Sripur virus]AJR28588.1 hypothetical protein [Sripur virus]